jgi:hypothetical protein
MEITYPATNCISVSFQTPGNFFPPFLINTMNFPILWVLVHRRTVWILMHILAHLAEIIPLPILGTYWAVNPVPRLVSFSLVLVIYFLDRLSLYGVDLPSYV